MKRRFTAARFAFAAAAALLALAAGCDALPAGDPPEGELTDNGQPPVTTPLALRNHLATQLIVYTLQNGVTELDPGRDPEAVAVAAEAARTAGFRLARNAPLRLAAARDADGMLRLAAEDAEGKVVWRSQRP
jgi:hypothetical protein